MRLPRRLRLIIYSLLLAPDAVMAELAVIYDSGMTQPIAPYLAVFRDDALPPSLPKQPDHAAMHFGAADVSQLLPIRTPELTPGAVNRRPLSLPDGVALPRPFFLVGSDPRSKAWLTRNRDRLLEIQAVGMLVAAESEADIEAIAAIAAGLPILPASASDIAPSLQITHIPVLVSERGVEQ